MEKPCIESRKPQRQAGGLPLNCIQNRVQHRTLPGTSSLIPGSLQSHKYPGAPVPGAWTSPLPRSPCLARLPPQTPASRTAPLPSHSRVPQGPKPPHWRSGSTWWGRCASSRNFSHPPFQPKPCTSSGWAWDTARRPQLPHSRPSLQTPRRTDSCVKSTPWRGV